MSNLYKTTFKYQQVEVLKEVIERLIVTPTDSDDEKLLFSVLKEIKDRLYLKLKHHFAECTMSFKAHEAIALRILFSDYVMDFTSYIGAKLFTISNEVHEHFNQ